jgi:hypothetical protein
VGLRHSQSPRSKGVKNLKSNAENPETPDFVFLRILKILKILKPDCRFRNLPLATFPTCVKHPRNQRKTFGMANPRRQGRCSRSELRPPTLFNPRKIVWPFSFRSRRWLQRRFFWIWQKPRVCGNLGKHPSKFRKRGKYRETKWKIERGYPKNPNGRHTWYTH